MRLLVRHQQAKTQKLILDAVQELEGLAEWQRPKAGMFIWLKLLAGVADVDDIAAELVQANVMVLPGKSLTLHIAAVDIVNSIGRKPRCAKDCVHDCQ